MNNFNLKNITESLLETFLEAGQAAKDISQKGVKVTIKEDKSPVTNGDLLVDKILKSKIKDLTPKTTIISEETVNFNSTNNKEKTFSILYHTIGIGTNILSKLKKNERVKIIGPLGNPIPFNHASKNFLLIAGGIGIAPLVWLGDTLVANNKNVTMLIGGRSKNHIFPIKKLKQEIEVEIFTDDGSLGTKGLATKKINNFLSWTDEIILCGPEPMFVSAHEIIKQYDGHIPAYALFEKEMACGIGICYGCAIKDKKNNPQLVCTKGPSFELSNIYL